MFLLWVIRILISWKCFASHPRGFFISRVLAGSPQYLTLGRILLTQGSLSSGEVRCSKRGVQFWNPSQGNLTTVHTLAHVKLQQLLWSRRILHKFKYWGLPARNLELKTCIGSEVKHLQETRSPTAIRRKTKTTMTWMTENLQRQQTKYCYDFSTWRLHGGHGLYSYGASLILIISVEIKSRETWVHTC